MAYKLCGPQFHYYLMHKLISDDELQFPFLATMLDRNWDDLTLKQYKCDMMRLYEKYNKGHCRFAYLSAMGILYKNRGKLDLHSDAFIEEDWLDRFEDDEVDIDILKNLSEIIPEYPKLSYLSVTGEEFCEMREYLDLFFDDTNNEKFHEFWKTLITKPPPLNQTTEEELMAELQESTERLDLEKGFVEI